MSNDVAIYYSYSTIQPDILSPPLLRLTSRKPLWLDLQPVDIKSRWRHNWKSAQVVNSHLVCDPHNPATRFRPPLTTVVSAKPFSYGTGTLRCLQKEMTTYRHWSVSLSRDPDDVSHCRILSPDQTEWRLISATLCGWTCCFVADQLWLMTRIREEDSCNWIKYLAAFFGKTRHVVQLDLFSIFLTTLKIIPGVSKKVAPLKVFGIFSL